MNTEKLLESVDRMTELVETCKTSTNPANILCALNGLTEQLNLMREAISADTKNIKFTDDELHLLTSLAKISYIMTDFAENYYKYDSNLYYNVFEKLGIADKVDFY